MLQHTQNKQEAFRFFEIENPRWLAAARAVAKGACLRFGFATADDVQAECPPPRGRKNLMGAVFNQDFVCVGYAKSKRPEARGHLLRMWKLK